MRRGRSIDDVVRAAVVGAALSGAPSTVHAIVTGADPLAAARAAGTIVPGRRPSLIRGALAHAAISIFWAAVLAAVLPRRYAPLWGGLAGLAIAGLDLGLVARRYPAIRALPAGPQLADHVGFGAIVGAVLDRRADRSH